MSKVPGAKAEQCNQPLPRVILRYCILTALPWCNELHFCQRQSASMIATTVPSQINGKDEYGGAHFDSVQVNLGGWFKSLVPKSVCPCDVL